MPEFYITFFFRQLRKTLSQFFYLSRANENFETWMPTWFEQDNKLKKFKVLSLDNILAKGHCLKKRKISSSAKTSTCSATIFIWLSSCEQLLKKFHFEFLHFFNFPAFEINLDPNFLELYYVFVQVCHKFATSKRRLII